VAAVQGPVCSSESIGTVGQFPRLLALGVARRVVPSLHLGGRAGGDGLLGWGLLLVPALAAWNGSALGSAQARSPLTGGNLLPLNPASGFQMAMTERVALRPSWRRLNYSLMSRPVRKSARFAPSTRAA